MFSPQTARRGAKLLVLLVAGALAACTGPLEPTNPYDEDVRELPVARDGVVTGVQP